MWIGYIRFPTMNELLHPRLLLFWGYGIFRNKEGVRLADGDGICLGSSSDLGIPEIQLVCF